jgi:hypothetical protein
MTSDAFIVGKMLGNTPLGYYTQALRLARFLGERVLGIVNQVSFPSFASVKDDQQKLLHHWFALTRLLALVNFPAMLALAMNAEDFVRVVLGRSGFRGGAFTVPLLCRSAEEHPDGAASVAARKGPTDLSLRYNILSTLTMPPAFVAGCRFAGLEVSLAWHRSSIPHPLSATDTLMVIGTSYCPISKA